MLIFIVFVHLSICVCTMCVQLRPEKVKETLDCLELETFYRRLSVPCGCWKPNLKEQAGALSSWATFPAPNVVIRMTWDWMWQSSKALAKHAQHKLHSILQIKFRNKQTKETKNTFLVQNTALLCSPGRPGTLYLVWAGLKLIEIFLLQLLKCWDYRLAPEKKTFKGFSIENYKSLSREMEDLNN